MFKKVFFSINLPENIKEELIEYRKEIELNLNKGVRWVEMENLHITLSFLGNIKEEKLDNIINEVKKIKRNSFEISLYNISYFPKDKKNAKMIWLFLESKDLIFLEEDIRVRTSSLKPVSNNDFIPHITLARINLWDYRKMEIEEIPDVNMDIALSFKVESFELMESKVKKGKINYKKIESFKLV